MNWLSFLCNLLIAAGLGGLIGFERQFSNHRAGIRTCVLVCVGASLFTCFPFCISGGDVTRAAIQIISGVGFLGSGIIFKDGSNVRGLNTAATIWCTAGIGIFSGAGLYLFALLAAVCLLGVNLLSRILDRSFQTWSRFEDAGRVYRLILLCAAQETKAVRSRLTEVLSTDQAHLFSLHEKHIALDAHRLEAKFFYEGKADIDWNEGIVESLSVFQSVREIEWELMD